MMMTKTILCSLVLAVAAACGGSSKPSPAPGGGSAGGGGGGGAARPCVAGGCSGTVCSDEEGVMTTCEWRPEYACYREAECLRQPDGACGWTQSELLTACLATPPVE